VALRTESDLTYEEIEVKAGISKGELLSWESGAKSPLLSDVAKLAAHCTVSAAVNFQVGFSKVLREAQTRIAELQSAAPTVDDVRRENFDALGAVDAFRMAA
jgi:transcriptional regulator with XRE-family HTH domain